MEICPFSFCLISENLKYVEVMLTYQVSLAGSCAWVKRKEAFLHLQQKTSQLNSKSGFGPITLWVSIHRHFSAPVARSNPYCPVHTYLHLLTLSDCLLEDVSVEVSNINDCESNLPGKMAQSTPFYIYKPQGQVTRTYWILCSCLMASHSLHI